MLAVIPFVVVASFFGRINGGNAIYKICSAWADLWFFFVGIYHKNHYETPHDKSRQYIFVANHISYLDAPFIVKTLRQNVRVLGKAEMSKIPLFGFIYRNAVVTVDRRSAEARAKSVRVLKSVLKKEISIFLFPEGTFNETGQPLKSFFDGAFKVAIEMQTPIKPILFLDGYDRMNYKNVFLLSPGRSRAIFLDEIPTAGLSMKDVNLLKQTVFDTMEQKLIEYKASWIRS
ncbi:MAG: 1-acyl-sn-glycerol-3-phosphate acyltransferase [Chitinophagaceae bacterium]|nr:MAG: 1-acyl-sn-glycerol-3-phosphate acyltransferase [Chitinophagaceae bacterium]